jgi:hypothetical protein
MARRKTATAEGEAPGAPESSAPETATAVTTERMVDEPVDREPLAESASAEQHDEAEAGHADAAQARKAEYADPRSLVTVSLGTSNDSPKMRLLRSYRFRQMQIQFDEEPDERTRGRLADAGWTHRPAEGIWTRQLPKEGERWRDAADAEALFKELANSIRAEKGLSAALTMV